MRSIPANPRLDLGRVAWVLILFLALHGPAPAQDPPPEPTAPPAEEAGEPALLPVPEPSLEGLEPAVAEQLAQAREELASYASLAGVPPAGRAEAYGELGRLYHAYGLAAPAEAAYRNAHALAPEAFDYAYLLAYLLQNEGRYEEAVEAYERARALQETPGALVHMAEALLELGRLDEAETLLRRVLSAAPQSPSARAVLGQIALSRGEHELAVGYLESALDAVPQATRLHYPLALAYRGMGQMEKAQEHLERRGEIGVRPPDPLIDELDELKTGERVHVLRGRTAFRFGDFEAAAREFRRAVEENPESVGPRVNLGSALGQLGDRIGAIHQFRQALEIEPENFAARYNLGVLLGLEGKPAEALPHLTRAVELQPGDGEAWRELAEALVLLGRAEDALAAYTRASGILPYDPDTRLGEVQLLVDLGRYEQAGQRLEESHAVAPREPRIVNGYARFLAAAPDPTLRDAERALALATQLMEAQPTAEYAETLALALAEAGRCDEAAEWQERALQAFRQAGDEARLPGLEAALARYRAGAPCGAPTLPEE